MDELVLSVCSSFWSVFCHNNGICYKAATIKIMESQSKHTKISQFVKYLEKEKKQFYTKTKNVK